MEYSDLPPWRQKQILNRHLCRDHRAQIEPGQSFADRQQQHRDLHALGAGADHDHLDLDDLINYLHHSPEKPPRVRTDRPPRKWTLTWHLAVMHNARIKGDELVKMMKHEELHQGEGQYGGIPLHRHDDLDDLSKITILGDQ